MCSPNLYLCCCLVLSLVNGFDCFKPLVYPARVTDQCGQQDTILNDQLMETLRNIQQQLSEYLDCQDAFLKGQNNSGIYTIKPGNQPAFQVYCDMDTDGGGWTVFQRRMDGSVDFYRNWTDYKQGFGNLTGEHWLGLSKIHRLTPNCPSQELRVDLGDFDGNTRYAHYENFSVVGANDNYRLQVSGYNGTAGDSLASHSGSQFSTYDQDNDLHGGTCAKYHKGGWWYWHCYHSNLNGIYRGGYDISYSDGVNWYTWKGFHYSLKSTEMKLRRKLYYHNV